MTLAADTTATYKGRNYRLVWAGDTKYGQRAKLAFFDGSREFWVDFSKVEVGSSTSSAPRRSASGRHVCEECGDYFHGGQVEDDAVVAAKRCWETGASCFAYL